MPAENSYRGIFKGGTAAIFGSTARLTWLRAFEVASQIKSMVSTSLNSMSTPVAAEAGAVRRINARHGPSIAGLQNGDVTFDLHGGGEGAGRSPPVTRAREAIAWASLKSASSRGKPS